MEETKSEAGTDNNRKATEDQAHRETKEGHSGEERQNSHQGQEENFSDNQSGNSSQESPENSNRGFIDTIRNPKQAAQDYYKEKKDQVQSVVNTIKDPKAAAQKKIDETKGKVDTAKNTLSAIKNKDLGKAAGEAGKLAQAGSDAAKLVKDAGALAANLAAQNYLGAIWNGAKILTNRLVKKAVANTAKLSFFGCLGISLIIMALFSGSALEAIEGGGGKSATIETGANSNEIKELLKAIKNPAKEGSLLGGAGSGSGITSKEGSTGSVTYQGKNGFSIKGYTNLKFTERDLEFINNILAKGKDPRRGATFDKRLIQALVYLANKHNYIYVSNVVSVYEDMPIDRENTSNPNVIKNISAHVNGQAVDIREIDFVYKAMNPLSCGAFMEPTTPQRDLLWFNDRHQLLLTQRCMTSITSPTRGGPIINGLPTSPIPIQIAWQDDQPGKSGNLLGTLRGDAERLLEQSIKLPAGSLDLTNGNSSLAQIGFAEIAKQVGVSPELVNGKNPTEFITNFAKGYAEKQIGVPLGGFVGNNAEEISVNMGNATMESFLNLPSGSIKGDNIFDMTKNIGQAFIEREFGFAAGTLNNPASAKGAFARELLKDEDLTKIAADLRIDKAQLSAIVTSAMNGNINEDALINLGTRRLERGLQKEDGSLDKYIQQARILKGGDEDQIRFLTVSNLSDEINFDDITLKIADKNVVIDEEKIRSILTSLGRGEKIDTTIKSLGGLQMDDAFGLERGSTELYVNNRDGEPLEQINLLSNNYLKKVGTAIYKGEFDEFAIESGGDLLNMALTNGPRNMTVMIDDNIKSKLLSDPQEAAEAIGEKILQTNLSLTSEDLSKLKNGNIANLSIFNNKTITLTESDISVINSKDLMSMPSVMTAIKNHYKISESEYQKIIKGDLKHVSLVQQEAAKMANIGTDDVVKLVDGDYKNISFVKDMLKNGLKWADEQINSSKNSELGQRGDVKNIIASKTGMSQDDISKIFSGKIEDTDWLTSAIKNKLGINKDDREKLINEQAKNVPALGNIIKSFGIQPTKEDLAALKQGDIKAMPSVQNLLKETYKFSNDDINKLFAGDITNIGAVQSALEKQFKLPAGDIEKLVSGDFKNLTAARDLVKNKYGINDVDINNVLSGDIAKVSIVKTELAKQLKLSESDLTRLIDSDFKNTEALKSLAKSKLNLSDDDIKNILSQNSLALHRIEDKLKSVKLLSDKEIGGVLKGNWLESDLIKTEFAKNIDLSVIDIENIKFGQIGALPKVQDLAMSKFDLNMSGLNNLMKGDWGEISNLKSELMSNLNISSVDFESILGGNIPSLSAISNALSQNFNLSSFDISNLTGNINIGSLNGLMDSLTDSLGLSTGSFGNVLSGLGNPTSMIGLAAGLGGGLTGVLGGDQQQVMDKVFRPEARYKVHTMIDELLDISKLFNNPNMKVTQLITYNEERDVAPFESKVASLYGHKADRRDVYGLFSMPEAFPNIHIGY